MRRKKNENRTQQNNKDPSKKNEKDNFMHCYRPIVDDDNDSNERWHVLCFIITERWVRYQTQTTITNNISNAPLTHCRVIEIKCEYFHFMTMLQFYWIFHTEKHHEISNFGKIWLPQSNHHKLSRWSFLSAWLWSSNNNKFWKWTRELC